MYICILCVPYRTFQKERNKGERGKRGKIKIRYRRRHFLGALAIDCADNSVCINSYGSHFAKMPTQFHLSLRDSSFRYDRLEKI